MKALAVILALTCANFLYAWVWGGPWLVAFERSYFQAAAIGIFYLMEST